MKLWNYIRVLRPKNLIIVAISQLLMFWIYLAPLSEVAEVKLDGGLWMLFILDTILIAAGGYVVNDILDQKADLFNKPEHLFIGPGKISARVGWIYYVLIIGLGFWIAYYIASSIGELHLLIIYPVAVALLYLYSRYFKRMPLLGNIVVSTFCAFVPAIIWYAEHELVNSIANSHAYRYEFIVRYFSVYIGFAFLSTMVREIIKDMEDVEGDRASGFHTWPILRGMSSARFMAQFFGLLLLCSYVFWIVGQTITQRISVGIIILVGLVIPTFFILKDIHKANKQSDYALISKRLKYIMIVSLFIFLCIPYILLEN